MEEASEQVVLHTERNLLKQSPRRQDGIILLLSRRSQEKFNRGGCRTIFFCIDDMNGLHVYNSDAVLPQTQRASAIEQSKRKNNFSAQHEVITRHRIRKSQIRSYNHE